MQRRISLTRLLGIALVALLAAPAWAQPDESSTWKTKASVGFEYQAETDLDDARGDFEYWLVSLAAGIGRSFGEQTKLAFNLDYRAIGYDFDSTGLDPWDTVHVFRVAPRVGVKLTPSWALVGGPVFEFSGESGADFDDSIRGGGMLGVQYRTRGRLSVILGALVQSEIEDDVYVQPFLHVNWRITDGLNLSTEAHSSRGGEFSLSYQFARMFEVGAGGGFRRERFRLDDDGDRRRRDGVGQEEAYIAQGHLAYLFGESGRLELYGGTTIDGEFRLEDDDGDAIRNAAGRKVGKSDYDAAGFGGIRLTVAF